MADSYAEAYGHRAIAIDIESSQIWDASWGTLSIPLRYRFHASGHGCHAQLPPRAMRSSRMKNKPETGGQPYEPFMFARKHGLSIDEARKILDEYGGDRAGSDAAATALSRREAKTAFTLHHLQRSQR